MKRYAKACQRCHRTLSSGGFRRLWLVQAWRLLASPRCVQNTNTKAGHVRPGTLQALRGTQNICCEPERGAPSTQGCRRRIYGVGADGERPSRWRRWRRGILRCRIIIRGHGGCNQWRHNTKWLCGALRRSGVRRVADVRRRWREDAHATRRVRAWPTHAHTVEQSICCTKLKR